MRFLASWECTQEEALEEIGKSWPIVAIDIETVNLENQLPVGIGVAWSEDRGIYFYDVEDPLLKGILERASVVIAHNAKFDIPLLRKLGHTVNNFDDSKTLAYSNGLLENSLEHLSDTLLFRANPSVTTLWRKKIKGGKEEVIKGNIGVDHRKLGTFCITHSTNCYALWQKLPKVDLYKDIDRPYLDLIMEMESWGLQVDQRALTEMDHKTTMEVQRVEQEIYQELGPINISSNPQVAKALQTKGILGTRKTKSGADSVSDESLAPLHNPIADKILEHRRLMKTISTYVPAFRQVDAQGRIHSKFGYAETGRLTSSKPNHQNITNNGLRDCLVPEKDYTYISLDASQLELRVVAQLSQDPLLVEATQQEDLHMATAIQVFGFTEDQEEMKLRRYNGKQMNFAILYGATDYKIAEMMDKPLDLAQEIIGSYFQTYKVLDQWILSKRKQAKKDGFVLNLFGRKRPLPDLHSGSFKLREKGEREVINTIVQGTAADIVKLAHLYLKDVTSKEVRFVLQVHDEILMEVPDTLVQDTLDKCKELEQAFPFYPFNAKIGKNYGKLEKVA